MRSLTRQLAAFLLPLALVCPVAAQDVSSDRSGMPWASGGNGGSGGMDALERGRGRLLDTRAVFLRLDRFENMVTDAGGASIRTHAATGARIEVAFGMLDEEHRGQHLACWGHQFSSYADRIGRALVANGVPDAIIRLGWEADRQGGFPWAVVAGKEREYIGCFRKWVEVLRRVPNQRFLISWTMQGKGTRVLPASTIYPGNTWVDIIGMDPYDRCPPVRTEADWQRISNAKQANGVDPAGVASWLAFARAHNRPFALPEWGIGGTTVCGASSGIDNPFFIRKMHEFFSANAAAIAYEAYFNAHGDGRPNDRPPPDGRSHRLYPPIWNPNASRLYGRLW